MRQRFVTLLPVRAVCRYISKDGGIWATTIAWNALTAIIPIALVAVALLGLLVHGQAQESIVGALANPSLRAGVNSMLSGVRDAAGPLTVVAFAGLLWRGSSLFGAIDKALAELGDARPRSFLSQRLMAFGMVIVFTVLLVPLIVSASLLEALRALDVSTSDLFATAFPAIQFFAGFLDATLIFFAIFRLVPAPAQRARATLPGAALSGLLLEVLTQAFPIYIKLTHTLATYGQAFGVALLLVAYFGFVGLITVLGACINLEVGASRQAEG